MTILSSVNSFLGYARRACTHINKNKLYKNKLNNIQNLTKIMKYAG